MSKYVSHSGFQIATPLAQFVEQSLLPGTGIESQQFWQGLADIFTKLTPINQALLEKRDSLQQKIDDYHSEHPDWQAEEYRTFLEEIGYLQPQPEDFTIETQHVEPEIAAAAAPQLVVPVNNARFALNAANARWGSLYDALYGTDVLSEDMGLSALHNTTLFGVLKSWLTRGSFSTAHCHLSKVHTLKAVTMRFSMAS